MNNTGRMFICLPPTVFKKTFLPGTTEEIEPFIIKGHEMPKRLPCNDLSGFSLV